MPFFDWMSEPGVGVTEGGRSANGLRDQGLSETLTEGSATRVSRATCSSFILLLWPSVTLENKYIIEIILYFTLFVFQMQF